MVIFKLVEKIKIWLKEVNNHLFKKQTEKEEIEEKKYKQRKVTEFF